MAVTFESYERRIDQIKPVMEKYGIKDFEDSLKICTDKGFNPYEIVKGVQPICFENAAWAYTLGAAIAIKKGCKIMSDKKRMHKSIRCSKSNWRRITSILYSRICCR